MAASDPILEPHDVHEVARRATTAFARSAFARQEPRPAAAEELLDGLLPPALDWRGVLGRWPLAALAAVGVVGYLVGRSRGDVIVDGVRAGLARTLAERLGTLESVLTEPGAAFEAASPSQRPPEEAGDSAAGEERGDSGGTGS